MNPLDYPTFETAETRVIPRIQIPTDLREDYEKRVMEFYSFHLQEEIESLARNLEKVLEVEVELLDWDNKLGFTHLRIGTHSGLDLENLVYKEHNINDPKTAIALSAIVQKYISLLI